MRLSECRARLAWGLCSAYTRSVSKLNPSDLRAYAGRNWSITERLARTERAVMPVARRVEIGIALYEAARATRPGWPDDATRRADFETHLRVKKLLQRAAHVGTR